MADHDDFTDLRGRSWQRLDLTGARLHRIRLDEARLRRVVFSGATLRGGYAERARMIGVELIDVEISGYIQNLVVNGVDVSGYVEAQLDERFPDRVKMRPSDPEGFREAWRILERLWAATVTRARALPPEQLHTSVDEEWSFVQTLRHLSFATASWLHRAVLGQPSPWHPLDLPWDEAPGWPGVPWDRDARPGLDEVLALRERRVADVRDYLASLTQAQLDATTSPVDDLGWPPPQPFTVAECLGVVLNEEWEHRRYAERDLDALGAPAAEG